MEQLLCHLMGDYWLQTDWMALNKKKHFLIALMHSIVYTMPFLFITQNGIALLIICISHAIIDGTNVVNRLNQIKNWDFKNHTLYDMSFVEAKSPKFITLRQDVELKDGYGIRPLFIRIWLIIIQDNTLHLLINFLVLKYIGG